METPPPGSLRAESTKRSGALADVPFRDLADELLGRLQAGETLVDASLRLELYAVLAMELEIAADAPHNRFSRRRLSDVFFTARGWAGFEAPPVAGQTYVELGCGSVNPLAALLTFVALGAKRAVGIDLDPPERIDYAARGVARCASLLLTDPRLIVGDYPVSREDIARNLASFDLLKLYRGDPDGLDDERLQYRQESATRTSLEAGEVDVMYSTSFVEHVADLDELVAEMARVTRSGGRGHHSIDGFDHHHYADPDVHPLGFLAGDEGAPLVHGSNRVRPLEFPPIFERHGFEVLRFEPHERVVVDDALRNTFVEPFRSMPREQLEVATAVLHVRRR